MQQQHTLRQVEGLHDEQVVLAVAAARDESIQGVEKPLRDVVLEALLQPEELAEGRVDRQLGEAAHRGRRVLDLARLGWRAISRQAELCQEALDLLHALFYLRSVERTEIIKGKL